MYAYTHGHTHLAFTVLGDRHYYYFHFTEGKIRRRGSYLLEITQPGGGRTRIRVSSVCHPRPHGPPVPAHLILLVYFSGFTSVLPSA